MKVSPNGSIQDARIWVTPYIDVSVPEKRLDRLRRLGVPEAPSGAD